VPIDLAGLDAGEICCLERDVRVLYGYVSH